METDVNAGTTAIMDADLDGPDRKLALEVVMPTDE
jgi:hypothetical protein